MTPAMPIETDDLSTDRRAAALIALPVLLSIAAVLHHPVVHVVHDASMAVVAAAVERVAIPNAAMHAAVLVALGLQTVGLYSFAARLGLGRLLVRCGLFFAAMATVLLFVAAVDDGFMTPLLAHGCRGEDCAVSLRASIAMEFAAIQAFTRVGLAMQALGMASWSLALAATSRGRLRAVGVAGLVVAATALSLLADASTPIDPQRLLALMAGGCAWSLGAAAVLWSGGIVHRATRTDDDGGRPAVTAH